MSPSNIKEISAENNTLIEAIKKTNDSNIDQFFEYLKSDMFTLDDLNKKDEFGMTGLHYAVSNHQLSIVERLLKYDDIAINSVNNDGNSPLMTAIEIDSQEIVSELINHNKTDINFKVNNYTALIFAAMAPSEKNVFEHLLKHESIDVNLRSKEGKSALSYATRNKHNNSIKLLCLHEKIDIYSRNLFLSGATHPYQIEIDTIEELITKNEININLQDDTYGSTALIEACDNSSPEGYMEVLLKHEKIDPNIKDYDSYTALWYAAKNDHEKKVKLLLRHSKVNFDIYDVLFAVINCNNSIMILFLEHYAHLTTKWIGQAIHEFLSPIISAWQYYCDAIKSKYDWITSKMSPYDNQQKSNRTQDGSHENHISPGQINVKSECLEGTDNNNSQGFN